jgi:hypothetical protein
MNMNKFVLIATSRNQGCPGIIRLGDVGYHFELFHDNETCAGGGMFFTKDEDEAGILVKELYLYGSSSNYGPPKFDFFNGFFMPEEYKGYKVVWLDEKPFSEGKLKTEPIDLTDKITFRNI